MKLRSRVKLELPEMAGAGRLSSQKAMFEFWGPERKDVKSDMAVAPVKEAEFCVGLIVRNLIGRLSVSKQDA